MIKADYGFSKMVNKFYIDTLTEAEIAKIEARLRPGRSSDVGFLGPHESLKEVIYKDATTLKRLGVTHEQIAHKLKFLGEAATVSGLSSLDGFNIELLSANGCQDDPFQEKRVWHPLSSEEYWITNSDGEILYFPGLIITLIRDYQFFEGKETPYRVDPETAVKVLKLK